MCCAGRNARRRRSSSGYRWHAGRVRAGVAPGPHIDNGALAVSLLFSAEQTPDPIKQHGATHRFYGSDRDKTLTKTVVPGAIVLLYGARRAAPASVGPIIYKRSPER